MFVTLVPSLPFHRRRQPLHSWLLAVLLHALVVWALWGLPVWADRGAQEVQRAPLLVRLLAENSPAAARAVGASPVPRMRPRMPEAITLPQPESAPVDASVPEPLAARSVLAPASAAPTGPGDGAALPPLNLTLPRDASAPWRQRNPALDDPRANTPKLTLEQKLANAMGGDGSWREERLDLDTVRFRRGNECLLAKRSRAGQLELGNGAFRNAWLVSRC